MLARKAGTLSKDTDVLAGESPADEVNGLEVVRSDFSDIFKPFDIGPVLCQDSPAVGVYLDLPFDLHACPLQAEVHSTDSAEEATDCNFIHLHSLKRIQR